MRHRGLKKKKVEKGQDVKGGDDLVGHFGQYRKLAGRSVTFSVNVKQIAV